MKKNTLLPIVAIILALAFCQFSCVPGSNKNINEVSADTTPISKAVTDSVIRPGNELIIRSKVTDYNRWKKGYDAGDSLRTAFGLSSYIIGRGSSDSNTVISILKMADLSNAKTFSNDAGWRSQLKAAGVVGNPTLLYFERVQIDTTKTDLKERVLVTYRVKNWDNWNSLFDKNKPARLENGLHERGVGHVAGDDHEAIVVFAIGDMQKAMTFLTSREIQNEMTKEGVEGTPDLFFYKIVQKY